MKNEKNNIGGFLLIVLIYVMGTIIALTNAVSLNAVMKNYQYNVLIILIVIHKFNFKYWNNGIIINKIGSIVKRK